MGSRDFCNNKGERQKQHKTAVSPPEGMVHACNLSIEDAETEEDTI